MIEVEIKDEEKEVKLLAVVVVVVVHHHPEVDEGFKFLIFCKYVLVKNNKFLIKISLLYF